MGKHIETSLAFIKALEENNLEEAESYLYPEFQMQGWTAQPLDLAGFHGVIGTILESFVRLNFHFNGWVEDQGYVKGIIQITAQQQESFSLPLINVAEVPLTGNSISLPREAIIFQFRQGKIIRWKVHHVTGGGLTGLIEQVGGEKIVVQ